MKNLFVIFIFAILTTACEKSTLKITYPNDNFFLNKMTGWTGLTIDNGGKTIKTTDNKTYEFEKTISGLGGIYKNENATGQNDDYMVIIPAGNEAHTITMKKEDKETLEEIIGIIGAENSGGIIGALTTTGGFDKNNVDSLKSNLSEDKVNALDKLINDKKLSNSNLGTYKKYT